MFQMITRKHIKMLMINVSQQWGWLFFFFSFLKKDLFI